MTLFRPLNRKEEHQFRKWAREHYTPLTPINGVWHPVVQDECRKMNEEHNPAPELAKLLEWPK